MNFFRRLVQSRNRGKIMEQNNFYSPLTESRTPNQEELPESGPITITEISSLLSDNLQRMKEVFDRCNDVTFIQWQYGPEMKHTAFSIYSESLIQKKEHNFFKESLQDLVTHEVGPGTMVTPEDVDFFFNRHVATAQSASLIEDFNEAINEVLYGNLVIFFDQWNKALSYKAIGLETDKSLNR